MLIASCLFNAIQTSAYVGYADHVQRGHSGLVGYLVYLFFFNVARATFLAVLLVVASGYCITRSDLGPHRQHVVFVPVTVLVTGLITDYSFFALQSSPNADTYDLSTMSTLAASMWFVCSVLNLAALILAWLYIFEALGKEVTALDEDYKARTGRLEEERRAEAAAEAAAVAAMAGHPGYAALAPPGGVAVGLPVVAPHTAAADVEAGGPGGGHEGETVADHIAYNAKRTLLSRFSAGVAAYLVADICVLLLPAFFNHVVQSTLQALLFLCYLVFTLVLLVLFRPQEASSYLMVGFSEEDAEEKGVNQLSTGIAMSELGGHGPDDSDDDEISRLNRPGSSARPGAGAAAAGTGLAGRGGGGSSGGGAIVGSRGAAKAEAKAAKAAVKAAKKAGKDDDRYRQLPALATTSADIRNYYAGQGAGGAGAAAGNGAGDGGSGLPVSTLAAGTLPPPPSYGAAVALPPPPAPAGAQRGRQPRTYVPQPAAPSGPFTLDGEEDEDEAATATRPLTGAGKGQYQD
ncbi:hypothetical protein CHLRE_06g256400v5 [Chlamydomonas reinhardtii]|uniref:Uncharacterized protein n=1 Tax=Chlamydomonas reinhardtii TaxID=3055 RepID=A0A2K3DME3_CHLRE|nr:uncharacterized protein CHLRE_06g256400v5 [Chlamydomonas reinhardtii]PNW81690.1 hypothetical protein CHLRE_06g256400v5 [Chlamydomonas reinhardtii]